MKKVSFIISFLLINCLILNQYAYAASENASLLHLYRSDLIKLQIVQAESLLKTLKSHDDLRRAFSNLEPGEHKNYLLNQLDLAADEPFKAPAFSKKTDGFELIEGEHKITVNLKEKTVSYGNKTLPLLDKSPRETLEFFQGKDDALKTVMNFLIPEAYAFPPIFFVFGLCFFAVLLALFGTALVWVSKKAWATFVTCPKLVKGYISEIEKMNFQCTYDLARGVPSDKTKELLKNFKPSEIKSCTSDSEGFAAIVDYVNNEGMDCATTSQLSTLCEGAMKLDKCLRHFVFPSSLRINQSRMNKKFDLKKGSSPKNEKSNASDQ